MNLNEDQRSAVETDGPLAVVAIPGSGKTTLSVQRAVRVIKESKDNRICMVVYNQSAAKELEERVSKSGADTSRLVTGTYHALALQQLRDAKIKFDLASPAKQNHLMIRAWYKAGCPGEISEVTENVDRLKSQPESFVDPVGFAKKNIQDEWFIVYTLYQELLQDYGQIDFSDILAMSVKGMIDRSIKPLAITHLIADEFQDTDSVQFTWLHLHTTLNKADILVIGDDDQAIYSFRFALGYQGFKSFIANNNAKVIKLKNNYRSHSEILDAADKLISHNKLRMNKKLISYLGKGGEVLLHARNEREEEFETFTDWYSSVILPNKVEIPSIAVLARTNAILDQIQQYLICLDIPFDRVGGKAFWDLRICSVLIETVNAIDNFHGVTLEQILSAGGVSHDHLDELSAQTNNYADTDVKLDLPQHTLEKWDRLKKHIKSNHALLMSGTEKNTNEVIANTKIFLMGFIKWPDNPSSPMNPKNLEIAANALIRLKGKWMTRMRLIQSKRANKHENVQLMTYHGSKGLEFDIVWMIASGEDSVPPKKVKEEMTPEAMEEERRLFYVAMTRAKKKLDISYSGEPCLFVAQIRGDDLEEIINLEKVTE